MISNVFSPKKLTCRWERVSLFIGRGREWTVGLNHPQNLHLFLVIRFGLWNCAPMSRKGQNLKSSKYVPAFLTTGTFAFMLFLLLVTATSACEIWDLEGGAGLRLDIFHNWGFSLGLGWDDGLDGTWWTTFCNRFSKRQTSFHMKTGKKIIGIHHTFWSAVSFAVNVWEMHKYDNEKFQKF